MKHANLKTITLGELKQRLQWVWELKDEDTQITFGGGRLSLTDAKMHLYRPDGKTPAIVDIEFNQAFEVTADSDEDA